MPLPVARACEKLAAQVEANPDRFMWFTYWPMLDEVRAAVAALVGASPDECVFVPNVSHGVSTVLRNFEWKQGDYIVTSTSLPLRVGGWAQARALTLPVSEL